MREYKVVEVKKKTLLKGAIRAEGIEAVLNKHAAGGWIFDKSLGQETTFIGKDLFLMIFYRET